MITGKQIKMIYSLASGIGINNNTHDDKYIRDLYKEFNIISVERPNNLSKGRYKELIIKNY